MSASLKHAWYNLGVVILSLLVVGCLYPFLGSAAHGGLGLLGLLGFGPLFYRNREGEVVTDERETLIQLRSVLLGYSVFWVLFAVVVALLVPLKYGYEGHIPVAVLQLSTFYAMVVFTAVASLGVLVQHKKG